MCHSAAVWLIIPHCTQPFMSHVKCSVLLPGANDPLLEGKEWVDGTYPATLVLSCYQSPAEQQPRKLPWRSITCDFRREIWYQCGLREHITDSLCEHTDVIWLFLIWTTSLGADRFITAGVNGVSVSLPQWVTLRHWNKKGQHLWPFAEGLCSEYIFFECWYFHRRKFAERQVFWTEASCTIVVVLDHLRLEQHQG